MDNKLPEVGSEWVCNTSGGINRVHFVDEFDRYPIHTVDQYGGSGAYSSEYFRDNFKPALELPEVGSHWLYSDKLITVVDRQNGISYFLGEKYDACKISQSPSLSVFLEQCDKLDEPLTNFDENGNRIKPVIIGDFEMWCDGNYLGNTGQTTFTKPIEPKTSIEESAIKYELCDNFEAVTMSEDRTYTICCGVNSIEPPKKKPSIFSFAYWI